MDSSCKGIGEVCDMNTNKCECLDGQIKDSNGDCRNPILGMYTANIYIHFSPLQQQKYIEHKVYREIEN